ncbi:MAG: alpha/beta hydrolase [Arcobacteraceae bacterium]|nr:alpha/beta hydrolase [Arcobacteraceae bacterium]
MAVKQLNYKNKLFDISYEILNPKHKDVIVFLHGWGSNKEIMKQAFGGYLKEYKHIYIDMPGFGKSNNNYVLTTTDYVEIIKEFLIQLDTSITESVVAGHSFGGKVATLLNPKKLVLLSSAGIVEEKSPKTLLTIRMAKIFNRFGLGKVTKMLRSKDVDQMSETMYETFKNVVDEDFSQSFAKYDGEALIFWGDKDTATTLNSGKTIHSLIKNSKFKVYDGDHYFFLKYAKDIANGIS